MAIGVPSIDIFAGVLTSGLGLSKPSKFVVSMGFPTKVTHLTTLVPEFFIQNYRMMFLCDRAQLPGKNLATTERRYQGELVKFPYNMQYSEITLGFICTSLMRERKYFDAWMNTIYNPVTNTFSYKKEYSVDINITQFGELPTALIGDALQNYVVTLREAFPIGIAAQELDWSATNQFHRLSVTFAYKKWLNQEIQNAEFLYSQIDALNVGGFDAGDLPIF